MGRGRSSLGVVILALVLVCCDAFHQPLLLWRWRPGFSTPLAFRGDLRKQGECGGREGRSTLAVAGAKMEGFSGSAGSKKVAVVGAGAVGLYYGARLREAGHDVSFLARSDAQQRALVGGSGLRVWGWFFDGIVVFDSWSNRSSLAAMHDSSAVAHTD